VARALDAIDRGVEVVVAAILGAMCVIGLLQVFNRFVLNASLSWSEEAQIFGHIWIVFLGIGIAYRRGAHLFVETFREKLPRAPGRAFDLLVELMWAAFALSMIILGWQVARVAALQESPGLEIPMSYPYYGMVLGGVYVAVVAVRRIGAWLRDPSGDAVP
jgi:TRAP-type C4-dicarboxylate transport system permease small subunit